jgi:hypothetical protein
MRQCEAIGQQLRQLEDENERLKQLVADLALDCEALKVLIRKERLDQTVPRSRNRGILFQALVETASEAA